MLLWWGCTRHINTCLLWDLNSPHPPGLRWKNQPAHACQHFMWKVTWCCTCSDITVSHKDVTSSSPKMTLKYYDVPQTGCILGCPKVWFYSKSWKLMQNYPLFTLQTYQWVTWHKSTCKIKRCAITLHLKIPKSPTSTSVDFGNLREMFNFSEGLFQSKEIQFALQTGGF